MDTAKWHMSHGETRLLTSTMYQIVQKAVKRAFQ
jgi:hypothetical protein